MLDLFPLSLGRAQRLGGRQLTADIIADIRLTCSQSFLLSFDLYVFLISFRNGRTFDVKLRHRDLVRLYR